MVYLKVSEWRTDWEVSKKYLKMKTNIELDEKQTRHHYFTLYRNPKKASSDNVVNFVKIGHNNVSKYNIWACGDWWTLTYKMHTDKFSHKAFQQHNLGSQF